VKNKNHYLNNKRFEEVILGYLQEPKEYEDELVSLLDILITNILISFKFKVDFDDAKQECFVLVFKTLKNFKPRSGSAFNYFTTVIVNNLKLLYTKNKKYQKKLQDYREVITGQSFSFGHDFLDPYAEPSFQTSG
jgi:DNA-directed RNA polymerase specialized sigma24 family protein